MPAALSDWSALNATPHLPYAAQVGEMDPASRPCIVLLLEMVTAANPASTRATALLEQAHGIEMDVLSGLFRPRDREWITKERSSHWLNMLFSSRLYFDSSMKGLFCMDSSSIVALFKAVFSGMVPNRDAPDAIVPPKRLAIFLYVCAHGPSPRRHPGSSWGS
ncbi:hypothetical protein PC121_g13080 [Phytophthora cactorum]|nr:hypothetical protein PC120_g14818 [Phytophthora cactorum]KAG3061231.1 hypothetical protein PC121_g13080 [Phytophthora cactorum]